MGRRYDCYQRQITQARKAELNLVLQCLQYRSNFAEKCKLLKSLDLQSIPKKFVKKYGDKLSNPVLLKLPNGSEWPVELRRWDGKAWFDNGWPDFSEFYSLRCGHWLVFQYDGNSKFNMFIFDRSCTEIDYPQAMPQLDSADQDDDSDDDLDDYSTHRGKSTLPCTRPHKKNRTSSSGKDNFPANKRGEGKSNTRRFEKQKPGYVGRMNPLTKNGKATALDRAFEFPCCHEANLSSTILVRLPFEFRMGELGMLI